MADGSRSLPPVLGRLLGGSFWIALRALLQAVFAFWSIPLILEAIGAEAAGAYEFAWGFGFLKLLLDFGMSAALQRQASEAWSRADRTGVDRTIAAGMSFYAAMAFVQAAVLLGIATFALPHAGFHGASSRLVAKLLWLQVLTAPCYGLTMVVASVVQACRRYSLIPQCESIALTIRFLILLGGLRAGVDFFAVVAIMTTAQIGLTLGPPLRIMIRDLGHVPHFRGARRADFVSLLRVSASMFLIQVSAVLSTNVDTTILGFALIDPGPATAVYGAVSKPFLMIRRTGSLLAYLVIPAVASLRAARDERGLERIKYDLPRFHLGLLLPVTMLAWIYAAPFLELWVGHVFPGRAPELTHLLRLFLVATLPLVIIVPVQMAIGLGKIEPIALAALAGALVNLPVSYALTVRLGVAGVIWGTVLTSLVANLLVPGLYVFRLLRLRMPTVLARTLGAPMAGAAALVAATWIARTAVSPTSRGVTVPERWLHLVAHLGLGCLAYLAGYLVTPAGRADLATVARRVKSFGADQISRPGN